MNAFKMLNFSFFSSIKFSAKEITAIIEGMNITKSGNLDFISNNSINVATIKMSLVKYAQLSDYISDMDNYFKEAVNQRAQLIVFPEYAGLLPMSLMPEYDKMINILYSETAKIDAKEFNSYLAFFSNCIYDIYYNTMSLLAAKYEIYAMAGSTLCFEDVSLRHRAFLFAPDGELAGVQDKLSLNYFEQELDVLQCGEVLVFDTIIGRISILTGSDCDYYETAKIAASCGAQIILNPTLFTHEYTPVDTAGGINLRVQENNNFYGVQSVLSGDTGLGITLDGSASFFAPSELIRSRNGVFAQSQGKNNREILTVPLDLEDLEDFADITCKNKDKNQLFMEKNISNIY